MKSLNLSGSQAEIVVKSLNERLYEFDEELDALESRIIEIRMKKSQLNNLLAELGGAPVGDDAPKKRGRKPGSGKKATAVSTDAAPAVKGKRGRKPGSGKKAAPAVKGKRGRKPGSGKKAAVVANAAPAVKGKRGRKPGSGKKAAVVANAAPAVKGKRGRKPGSGKKAALVANAAPAVKGKRGRKPGSAKVAAPKTAVKVEAPKAAPAVAKGKSGSKAKVAAPKAVAKAEAPAKTSVKVAAPKKAAKADSAAKRGRKTGGENTLASKIVSSIQEAKKGLSTREIVDAINTRYGAEKDERKLIQAVSSTLISLTKRGKIKRENGNDGQILNIVVS